MTNTLEYIESYFSGNLTDEEKDKFEKKCETDPVFSEEVSFYIAARDSIRKELHKQKKKEFDEMYTQLSSGSVTSQPLMRKLTPFITTVAAACLVLFLGWMFFFNSPSPQQLASNYVEDNLQTLSVTMNGSEDSLQLGIAAFNRQDYSSAERIFYSLSHQDALAPEAIKNLGLLYLVNGQYDKALVQFDSLSAYENLYANPGPFYKAVTLMKRSKGRDQEEARAILQEVIDKQLPGSKEAERWIENF